MGSALAIGGLALFQFLGGIYAAEKAEDIAAGQNKTAIEIARLEAEAGKSIAQIDADAGTRTTSITEYYAYQTVRTQANAEMAAAHSDGFDMG